MTASTLQPPSATNGKAAASVAEYVRSLPPEGKQAAFLALLREALEENGDSGLLPIDDEQGKPFGYYVPPKAAEELFRLHGPKLSEEREQEIDRRIKSLHPGIPIDEVIADFKRQLAELPPQPQ
jgi:hypothetical protein